MSALLILTSRTGNTRTFVEFFKRYSKVDIEVCSDFNVDPDLYDRVAIGTYTWSNGKIPKQLKKYLIDNHQKLKDKKVFIFGSGLSVYPKFCGAVDGINKICADSKADVIGTFKFEQRFIEEEHSQEELEELVSIIKTWSAL